jgi:CheY-like chemotaxis protein/HPt (histidine-containing phosphotransfer) domain-containing protein
MKTGENAAIPLADRAAKKPLKPARILVAEDSPDHRLLLQAYMKDSPHSLTFEEDGKAALDRFATSDFDLILMDVRMPVMDGLAATRAIRALERERGDPSVPIVALTAGGSLQDIERSTEAGCNAELSKPISNLELLRAIERYGRRPEPMPGAEPMGLEPVRIEMPSGLEEIVPGYLEMRRQGVREMTDLLSASDFERLADLGHQLNGSGGDYGFPELTRLGAALEESAKMRDRVNLRSLLHQLKIYLDRVELVAKP